MTTEEFQAQKLERLMELAKEGELLISEYTMRMRMLAVRIAIVRSEPVPRDGATPVGGIAIVQEHGGEYVKEHLFTKGEGIVVKPGSRPLLPRKMDVNFYKLNEFIKKQQNKS